MATKEKSITFRVEPSLRKILSAIATENGRVLSSQVRIALIEWLKLKKELHPEFIKEIKASIKSGKPEPVWKG